MQDVATREEVGSAAEAGETIDERYIVPGLSRGLALLQLFTRHQPEQKLTEIAAGLGLSRSATYRLVYTLENDGFLRRDPNTRRYRLTAKVLSLGFEFLFAQPLTDIAQPFLRQLVDTVLTSGLLRKIDAAVYTRLSSAGTAFTPGAGSSAIDNATLAAAQLAAAGGTGITVAVNPMDGIKIKEKKTKGHIPWSEADLSKYERRWPVGTRERVMLDVYCYTGLRRGDAARVGKQHVKNGDICMVTEKSPTEVAIPILQPLAKTLAAGPVGYLAFNVNRFVKPFTSRVLGKAFHAACKSAVLAGRSAHGLRKAAATRAAENGAT